MPPAPAFRMPSIAQTQEAITSPNAAANETATLTGSPARKPRPASSTAVSGLTLATVSSQPPSWARTVKTGVRNMTMKIGIRISAPAAVDLRRSTIPAP